MLRTVQGRTQAGDARIMHSSGNHDDGETLYSRLYNVAKAKMT
jgi:hypothetical protein